MNTYDKVKTFLEKSNNLHVIKIIAIEMLDNGNDHEFIYTCHKKEIDKTLNTSKDYEDK